MEEPLDEALDEVLDPNLSNGVLRYFGPSGCDTVGTANVVATCGTYSYLGVGSASGNTAQLTVIVTPGLGGSNHRIGVGYDGFNIGVIANTVSGASWQFTFSLTSSGSSDCRQVGSLTVKALASGTAKQFLFSEGDDLDKYDRSWAEGDLASQVTSPSTASFSGTHDACSSGQNEFKFTAPKFSYVEGHTDRVNGGEKTSFQLWNTPTTVTIDVSESGSSSDVTQTATITHSSSNLDGSITFEKCGTFSFGNLPQTITAKWRMSDRSGRVDCSSSTSGDRLKYFQVTSGSFPSASSAYLQVDGEIMGYDVYGYLGKPTYVNALLDFENDHFDVYVPFSGNSGTATIRAERSYAERFYVSGSNLGNINVDVDAQSDRLRVASSHSGSLTLSANLPGSGGSIYIQNLPTSITIDGDYASNGNLQDLSFSASGGSSNTYVEYLDGVSGLTAWIRMQGLNSISGSIDAVSARCTDKIADLDATFSGNSWIDVLFSGNAVDPDAGCGSSSTSGQNLYVDAYAWKVRDLDLILKKSNPLLTVKADLAYAGGYMDIDARLHRWWGGWVLDPGMDRTSSSQYRLDFPYWIDQNIGIPECETGTYGKIKLCSLT